MVTMSGERHRGCVVIGGKFEGRRAMVTRSGERHRGCVVIGVSLRAARDGYKVWKASSGLWEDWGQV